MLICPRLFFPRRCVPDRCFPVRSVTYWGGGGGLEGADGVSGYVRSGLHCKYSTLYRKFETNIPRNETARPCSQFLYFCICEQFMYSHDGSKIVDRSLKYINRSQIHECGNWERDRAVSFLGIHNRILFAVCRGQEF
jgi:hypothetical protein